MMDEPLLALPYLNYAIANNTGNLRLDPVKPLVQQVILLKQKLAADTQNTAILKEIAEAYREMDNKTVALWYADKILAAEPRNPAALQLKEQLK